MSALISLALLAAAASPAAAFWRLPCAAPIITERTDPIVAPGKVSAHTHTIMGGNGFKPTMNYNDTQDSTCSSCTVVGDNSNYWVPTMFYQNADGTFESVEQNGGALIYYLQRAPKGKKIQAFPPGFRMVAGDPLKRSGGSDHATKAISYACLNYNGGGRPETNDFPNYNCPNGLRAQVFFPSCWDGVNLDSPDHKSHVAYPIDNYNGGSCPPEFPVHLVSLFYEVLWETNKFSDKWHGNKQPFVFSHGDPTGYGGHGDFIMGWDPEHLQRAINECTNNSGRVEDCPAFQLIPNKQAEGCTIPGNVNEEVFGSLKKLPGCNPIQAGPGRAQPAGTDCGAGTELNNGTSSGPSGPQIEGWNYVGCGTDNYYNRLLTAARSASDDMTNEKCTAFCASKGFSVAGTEYARECYCGNSIRDDGAPVPGVPGTCKMECAGDATQKCGGWGVISLFQTKSASKKRDAVTHSHLDIHRKRSSVHKL